MADLYPNDGATFYVPEKPEKEEISAELSRAQLAYPILDELLAWFDESIAKTDSVASVKAEAKLRGITDTTVLEAYDIVREVLTAKRNELETMTFSK
jgi:hypothetical protein